MTRLTIDEMMAGRRVFARDLEVGDVIYGTDKVTKLYRHRRHAWRVVAETTGGEYSFPETSTVPIGAR